MFPEHTPAYLAASRALDEKHWKPLREKHFARYLSGEITHASYCALLEPGFQAYSKALRPHWIKAGGVDKRRFAT